MTSVLQKFSDSFLCRYDTHGESCVVGLFRDADLSLLNYNFIALANCIEALEDEAHLSNVVEDTSPTLGGDLDANGETIFGHLAAINSQVGTTYETVDSDSGKALVLNNASPITVTVHDTAAAGFNLLVIQKGAGQVTIAAGGTGTVLNASGDTKTSGQYAMATVFVEANAGTAPQVYLGRDTGV